jgi:hypothetical protein
MIQRQKKDGWYAYPDHHPMLPFGWLRRLAWKAGVDPLTTRERLKQVDIERAYWKETSELFEDDLLSLALERAELRQQVADLIKQRDDHFWKDLS